MDANEKLTRIEAAPAGGLQRVGYAVPHWVTGGDPVESAHVFSDARATRAVVGVWEANPGTLTIDDYPYDEFCVVLSGACVLTPAGGVAQQFGAGDAFLIRKGFRGTWEMPSGLRKWYVELHA